MIDKIYELAVELRALKTEKEGLSEQLVTANKRIEEIERHLLPDAMDEANVRNVKYDGVGKLYLKGSLFVSIPAEARAAAYQWLIDTGRGSLIQETVNSSALKAAAKSWISDGEQIPEDLIKVTPYTAAVLTK